MKNTTRAMELFFNKEQEAVFSSFFNVMEDSNEELGMVFDIYSIQIKFHLGRVI